MRRDYSCVSLSLELSGASCQVMDQHKVLLEQANQVFDVAEGAYNETALLVEEVNRETVSCLDGSLQNTVNFLDESQQKIVRIMEESRQEIARMMEKSRQETVRIMEESRQETVRMMEESRQRTARMLEESRQETARMMEESRQKTARLMEESRQMTARLQQESCRKTNRIMEKSRRNIARLVEEMRARTERSFEETRSLSPVDQVGSVDKEDSVPSIIVPSFDVSGPVPDESEAIPSDEGCENVPESDVAEYRPPELHQVMQVVNSLVNQLNKASAEMSMRTNCENGEKEKKQESARRRDKALEARVKEGKREKTKDVGKEKKKLKWKKVEEAGGSCISSAGVSGHPLVTTPIIGQLCVVCAEEVFMGEGLWVRCSGCNMRWASRLCAKKSAFKCHVCVKKSKTEVSL